MKLVAGFSSSPLGFSQRASHKIAPSRPNDEREKANAVFENLILEVHTLTSVIIYWPYLPALVKMWKEIYKGLTTRRRQGSLGAIGSWLSQMPLILFASRWC